MRGKRRVQPIKDDEEDDDDDFVPSPSQAPRRTTIKSKQAKASKPSKNTQNKPSQSTSGSKLMTKDIYKDDKTQTVHPPYSQLSQAPLTQRCGNILQHQSNVTMGMSCRQKHSVKAPVVSMLKGMQLFRNASPFQTRATAVEWHPTHPSMLAVASKWGDIFLWNHETVHDENFTSGIGPGGCVYSMAFLNDTQLVTASGDGTILCRDVDGRMTKAWLDTGDCYNRWFCSLSVQHRNSLIACGDTAGNLSLVDKNGNTIMSETRLNHSKIHHCEWSPREDWLLCTSGDKGVSLWDIRNMKDKKSALYVLPHERGVNSASFSLTDGTRLLTTDKHHELRVYQAPDFRLETSIQHPHRFYQYLTPIKAHWHPLQDLIVVGHYPDEKVKTCIEGKKGTVDILDAASGNIVCQLYDPAAQLITSLSKFNKIGDCLAVTCSSNIHIWRRQEVAAQKQEKLLTEMKAGVTPVTDTRRPRAKRDDSTPGSQRGSKTKATKAKKMSGIMKIDKKKHGRM